MFSAVTARIPPVWLERLKRHRAWILVGLAVLLVLVVRIRLREMPLERDEGEYAYAGQLMLQGVPPYKEAYNMKLPGTYAAYAVIMALFGQSASAIHVGLALVNAASVTLLFLIGRKLMDEITGIVAAIVFALLSLSPSVLGLAAHATHFVTLFALAGIFVLLKALESRSPEPVGRSPSPGSQPGSQPSTLNYQLLSASGLFFGLAFLMKQQGLFFGIFGGVYLVWLAIRDGLAIRQEGKRMARRRGGPRPEVQGFPIRNRDSMLGILLFSFGFLLPYALTCLILWRAGVFHQFIFWTISYASKYATAVPLAYGPALLRRALDPVVGPNLGLWLLAGVGAFVMWWNKRLSFDHRFLIITLLICSFGSVSVGFHFRKHYFITLLPVLALLCGVAASHAIQLLKHQETVEPLLAAMRLAVSIPILGVFLIGSLAAIIGNGSIWFARSPADALWASYGTSAFSEAVKLSDYIKANSTKNSRIAVIGSEPEIYFYSQRLSATGYIYTYPLMEPQPYALKMQEELISEIERARPEWVVYINDDLSWLPFRASERKIFDWWKGYWDKNLEMISMTPVREGAGEEEAKPAVNKEGDPKYIMLLKRRGN